MGSLIEMAPQKLMRWHGQDELAARREHLPQRDERLTLFGYVLENVEHGNEFEFLPERKVAGISLHERPCIAPLGMRQAIEKPLHANHKAVWTCTTQYI